MSWRGGIRLAVASGSVTSGRSDQLANIAVSGTSSQKTHGQFLKSKRYYFPLANQSAEQKSHLAGAFAVLNQVQYLLSERDIVGPHYRLSNPKPIGG